MSKFEQVIEIIFCVVALALLLWPTNNYQSPNTVTLTVVGSHAESSSSTGGSAIAPRFDNPKMGSNYA